MLHGTDGLDYSMVTASFTASSFTRGRSANLKLFHFTVISFVWLPLSSRKTSVPETGEQLCRNICWTWFRETTGTPAIGFSVFTPLISSPCTFSAIRDGPFLVFTRTL